MQAEEFIKSSQKVEFSAKPGEGPICIVDSSFNPPNRAHIHLARLCGEHFSDATVVFMLGTGNADKPSAPPEQLQTRLEMMELAKSEVKDVNCVLAMTTESRFVDKAVALHAKYGKRLVFAMGFDTLVRFGDAKYYTGEPIESVYATFFNVAEILVLTRIDDSVSGTPAMGSVDAQKSRVEEMFGKYATRIHVVTSKSDTEEISSSRARLAAAELRRQVPKEVGRYILEKELY